MSTILEDLGNCVKFGDAVIPAVNIQIDGFPQIIDDVLYPIYFEIMFERFGDLWTVEKYDDRVKVEIHTRYAFVGSCFVSEVEFSDWDQFFKTIEAIKRKGPF